MDTPIERRPLLPFKKPTSVTIPQFRKSFIILVTVACFSPVKEARYALEHIPSLLKFFKRRERFISCVTSWLIPLFWTMLSYLAHLV